jgi:hypothetical protein
MNKICTKCKVEKPATEFYKDKRKTDGLRSWCIECQKQDNKKRESSYNETRRNYRLTHKEESRSKKRDYYKQNKEVILANNSKWRQTFNGRLLSYKVSATKRGFDWLLTDEEFASFWQKDCFYCGDEIKTIGIDRIDSTRGYTLSNLVPCCTQCNIMKMDYSNKEFLNKIKQIYELQRSKGGFNKISTRGKL